MAENKDYDRFITDIINTYSIYNGRYINYDNLKGDIKELLIKFERENELGMTEEEFEDTIPYWERMDKIYGDLVLKICVILNMLNPGEITIYRSGLDGGQNCGFRIKQYKLQKYRGLQGYADHQRKKINKKLPKLLNKTISMRSLKYKIWNFVDGSNSYESHE